MIILDEATKEVLGEAPEEVLDEAAKEFLTAALSQSGSPEQARMSITAWLCAMAEALHSRGAHPWQLRVLLGALEDLDRGIVHPILKPAFKPASGPQHPTTHWEARASIVLALETRMALGEHKLMAANRVAREIRDALYANANTRWNDDPAKLLLNWRDRLNRAGRGSAPRDGEHWDALEEGRAHIRHCDTLEPAERAAELHRFYKRTLGYARQLLAVQPLKARAQSHRITG